MEVFSYDQELLKFMNQIRDISLVSKLQLAMGTLKIIGDLFYDLCVPSSWQLCDIKRIDGNTIIFYYWFSATEQAQCPECNTTSLKKSKTYRVRYIQDLAMSGITCYHAIKSNRYCCTNSDCSIKTFVEQFSEIADMDARLSNRLKDFIVRQGIESSCNGLSISLKKIGIKVSRETINREIKKKGAVVIGENLQRKDVNVLSVDDINLRKGNSSTACTVFIDAETHRVLVIAQSATCVVAQKIIKQFPTASILSRDRGSAFSSAGKKEGKEQVADRFHLVQNIHQTIKDIISTEMPYDIFIRNGDGLTRMVNSADEDSASDNTDTTGIVASAVDTESLVVISSANEKDDDVEIRTRLAGLNASQADKYRKTRAIIEMAENGLRTGEIAKRLSISKLDVISFRRDAPKILNPTFGKIA